MAAEFVIETPDERAHFPDAGSAAAFLIQAGLVDLDREPTWHVRWSLDRMPAGESADFGVAVVTRY